MMAKGGSRLQAVFFLAIVLLLLSVEGRHGATACSGDRCQNGGSCLEDLRGGYSCRCPPSHTGDQCHLSTTCNGVKCLNAGFCSSHFTPPNNNNNNNNLHNSLYNTASQLCLCLPGYTGPTCASIEPKSPCLSHPCLNAGLCIPQTTKHNTSSNHHFQAFTHQSTFYSNLPTNHLLSSNNPLSTPGYTCVCPEPFRGVSCEVDTSTTDPCLKHHCLHQSTCVQDPGDLKDGYFCSCTQHWKGEYCEEDVNECLFGPCFNQATCINTLGSYYCLCRGGYTGYNCEEETDECELEPCLNGGRCIDLVGSYSCLCPAHKNGLRCEYDNACMYESCNNGVCHTDLFTGQHQCSCNPGFSGKDCSEDVDECTLVEKPPCDNSGQCINTVGSFQCKCAPGFAGSRCDVNVDECSSQPCLNRGTCLDQIAAFKCVCLPEYTGFLCEIKLVHCASNPCQNKGLCQEGVNRHVCACPPGFTGENCQIMMQNCSQKPCGLGGKCVDDDEGDFFCHCYSGFSGLLCEVNIDDCAGVNCGHGSCEDGINSFVCRCQSGYQGHKCRQDIDECLSGPCSLDSTCQNLEGTYVCLCPKGTYGQNCEIKSTSCSTSPCENGGVCEERLNSYLCTCLGGFHGERCEADVDECSLTPSVCVDGATCTNILGSYRCLCEEKVRLGGGNREDSREIGSGGLKNGDEDKVVERMECYRRSHCHEKYCLNGGICTEQPNNHYPAIHDLSPNHSIHPSSIHSFSTHLTCLCRPGYKGRLCQEEINECLSKPCLNEAYCVDLLNSYVCSCKPGYSGLQCQINDQDCTDSSCLNGGTCVDDVNAFQCRCSPGYHGNRCQHKHTPCSSDPCLNKATCVDDEDSMSGYICMCREGLKGERCGERVSCSDAGGSRCRNGGTCVERVGRVQCVCQPGWVGVFCEVPRGDCRQAALVKNTKLEDLCLNGGRCVSKGHQHHCECQKNYIGSYCERFYDPCVDRPCFHGGVCVSLMTGRRAEGEGFKGSSRRMSLGEGSKHNGDISSKFRGNHTRDYSINQKNRHLSHTSLDFMCECGEEYEGLRCERKVDACRSGPCMHGGVCASSSNPNTDFVCSCPVGFAGLRCELKVNGCGGEEDESSRCFNGGVCRETSTGHKCICPVGFTGRWCEGRLAGCQLRKCKNGGICSRVERSDVLGEDGGDEDRLGENEEGAFVCRCAYGFFGEQCESNHFVNFRKNFRASHMEYPIYSQNKKNNDNNNNNNNNNNNMVKNSFMCVLHGCHWKADDGVCDEECNTEECLWDGNDCFRSDPFISCPHKECKRSFNDSVCDATCDTEACLYDGWDCLPPELKECSDHNDYCSKYYNNGHCDVGCNSSRCGWDGLDCLEGDPEEDMPADKDTTTKGLLFLVLMKPQDFLPLSNSFSRQFSLLLKTNLWVARRENGELMVEGWYDSDDDEEDENEGDGDGIRIGGYRRIRKRSADDDTLIGSKVFTQLISLNKPNKQHYNDNNYNSDNSNDNYNNSSNKNSNNDEVGFEDEDNVVRYISMALRSGFEPVVPIHSVRAKRFKRSRPHQSHTATTNNTWLYVVATAFLVALVAVVVVVVVLKGKRKLVALKGGTWYPNIDPTVEAYKTSNIRNSIPHINGSCLLERKEMSMSEDEEEDDNYSNTKRRKNDQDCKLLASSQTTYLPLSSSSSSSSSSSAQPTNPPSFTSQPSPLMLAVISNSDVTVLRELLDRGEVLNAKDHNGNTALHIACQRSKPEKTMMLLDEVGVSVNEENLQGRTPLHEAVAAGSDECVQLLLENKKTKLNPRDENGVTPLIQAVKLVLDDIFNTLVHSAGVDVDAKDSKGRTALHWCAMLDNEEAAKVLLKRNAKRDIPDCHQETPLYLAAKEGNINMVKLLKNHCANTNLKSDLGYLALDEAQRRKMRDICEVLQKPDQPLKSMSKTKDDNDMYPSYIFKQVNLKHSKGKDAGKDATDLRDGKNGKDVLSPQKLQGLLKKNSKVEYNQKSKVMIKLEGSVVDESYKEGGVSGVKTDMNNNITGAKNNSDNNSDRPQQLRRNNSTNNSNNNRQLKKPISRLSSANFLPAPTTTSPPIPTTSTPSYPSNDRPLSGDLGFDVLSSFVPQNEPSHFEKNEFLFNDKSKGLYLNHNNNIHPFNNNEQKYAVMACTITQQAIPRNDNTFLNSNNCLTNIQNTPNNKTISLYELSPPDSLGMDSTGCISPQSNLTISPTPSNYFSPNQQKPQQLLLLKQQKQLKNPQFPYLQKQQIQNQNNYYNNNDTSVLAFGPPNNNMQQNYVSIQQQQQQQLSDNPLTGSGALASYHNNYKNNKIYSNNNFYNTSNQMYNTYNNTHNNTYDPSYNSCLTPSPEYNDPSIETPKNTNLLNKKY